MAIVCRAAEDGISSCPVRSLDLDSALPGVLQKLGQWSGYEIICRVLSDHPDLRIFLAGGLIRNWFVDPELPARDYDFFLSGPSLAAAIDQFAVHGTMDTTPYGSPRWHPAGDREQYADLIPIEDFRPGLWKCEDIVDVLNQFDFTASAIAFDLQSGQSFDPQNGLRDLLRRTMRMVRFDFPEGPFLPGASITRNAILWFRILHYARALDFKIEPLTLRWLRAQRHLFCQHDLFSTLFFEPREGYLNPL